MTKPLQAERANDPTAPLRVLLVGAGGRDHALAWKLRQSPRCADLHAAPGNAGMAHLGTCHDVDPSDFDAVTDLAVRLGVDLAIVGAEDLLVAGLADRLHAAGVACVGPTKQAAQIEGSKCFAKQLMDDLGVPTPRWQSFADAASAKAALRDWNGPVAVKADGLAGGRGAFVCRTQQEAFAAVDALLVDSVFGRSGDRIVVEELIAGREVSVMVLTDGEHVVSLPSARDYKRLLDGDRGPNTGGMGAHVPSPDLDAAAAQELAQLAVRPVIAELARRGSPFRGVMYAGVMLTDDGPQVLEYNCRFGNPETQALVRVLDGDLLDLLARAAAGSVRGVEMVPADGVAIAVCVAAPSYPGRELEAEPFEATGLREAADTSPEVEVFFGLVEDLPGGADAVMAAGGRIATVTAHAETFEAARDAAYEAADRIRFEGKQLRRDIGVPALSAR